MLMRFNNIGNLKNMKEQGKSHEERLRLLSQSIDSVLNDNSYRVYIDDSPYTVEFKFPDKFDLKAFKLKSSNKGIQSSESNVIGGEILVHTFVIFGMLESVQVLYKPLSRPRL